MPQRLQTQITVAENLCRLAKDFKSGDQQQAAIIKREFKQQSKNDVVRATVYLMEVIGSRDQQFKALQDENKDLKELLNLKAPGWDQDDVKTDSKGGNISDNPSIGSATDLGVTSGAT